MSSPKAERAVLVTRPEPEASELARMLRRCGLRAVLAPLFTVEGLPSPVIRPHDHDAVLFTSPRAVRFAPEGTEALPAYVVGGATGKEACRCGHDVRNEGPGAANDQLADEIPEGTRLLHVSGRHVSGSFGAALLRRGVTYRRIPVYDVVAADALPDAAAAFLDEGADGAVTLLSARAAATFADLTKKSGRGDAAASLLALCLSQRVEEALKASLPAVRTAVSPATKLSTFVDFACSHCT